MFFASDNGPRSSPARELTEVAEFFERDFEQAVRWGRWKAVRHAPGAPLELYDLAAKESAVIARNEEFLKTVRTESAEWPLRLVRSPGKDKVGAVP